MPEEPLKVKVQNLIRSLVKDRDYPSVTYSNGVASVTPGAEELISPEVVCNELSTAFEVDERYGRSLKLKRRRWEWQAIASFKAEVSLDRAEQFFADLSNEQDFIIPAIAEVHPRAVVVYQGMDVEHPTTHKRNGTAATLRFQVLFDKA